MIRYTSSLIFDPTLVGLDGLTPGTAAYNTTAALSNSVSQNHWPAALYFNTSIAYDFWQENDRRAQVYFNIDNLFDKQPPIVAISISGSPYDLVGRSFKLGVRVAY
jgi:outer membrane receptor protein involved in Fe transport